MFSTKTASRIFPPRCGDAGTCRTWSTERPSRWLKKPWNEISPSSPGERSSELLEISPQKVHGIPWWWRRLGCFLMVYIISYWMKGFVFQLLIDLIQMKWTSSHRDAWFPFEIVHILKVFLPCIFPKPDGAGEGAETSLTVLPLLQGLKNSESSRCRGLGVEILFHGCENDIITASG